MTSRDFRLQANLCLALLLLASCGAQPELRPRDARESPPHISAKVSPSRSEPGAQQSGRPGGRGREIFLSSLSLKASSEAVELAREAKNDAELAQLLSVSWKQGQADPWLRSHAPQVSQVPQNRWSLSPFFVLPDESEPTPQEATASFVVDYQEESVKKLLAEHPDERSPAFWEALVHRFIENKTYTRGFDIASQTARLRAGDCTEHAVLLTALLRAQGIPARVMLGVIVVFHAGEPLAGGHAWVEYRAEHAWERLDAACYQESQQSIASAGAATKGSLFGVASSGEEAEAPRVIRRVYLPRMPLLNEGPGFARDLMRFQADVITGIEVRKSDQLSTEDISGSSRLRSP